MEKLQVFATTLVRAMYKTQWLHWWDSSSITRELLRCPLGDVKESNLEYWVIQASFWVQIQLFPLFFDD